MPKVSLNPACRPIRNVFRLGLILVLCGVWGGVACDGKTPEEKTVTPEHAQEKQGARESTQDAGTEPVVDTPTPIESKPEPTPEKVDNSPYTIQLFDNTTIHSVGKVNVRSVKTKFKLRHKTFAQATFILDLKSPCYPLDNPNWSQVPAGHNWPAPCDAFDRNMDITLNPGGKDGPPGFEFVRAITPFGGPLQVKANVTDLLNGVSLKKLPGFEHVMRVGISTYSDGQGKVSGSKGSWIISARLELTPGAPPRNVIAAIPLFHHSYRHNDAKKEVAKFTIPEGVRSTILFYSVTGHGGGKADRSCIGHADEFCRRMHVLYADDKQIHQFIPWRSDCKNYCTEVPHPRNSRITLCKENPCGNKNSVRAPRANWCPGTITPPHLERPQVYNTPGEHSFGYAIRSVAKGGSWKVTSHILVYGH